jgi:dephospho-CoA kinase
MFCIGITGGIGSGKSTVVNLFKKYNIDAIDSDTIARKLVEQNQPAYEQIVEHFSFSILDENKNIDRKKLRQTIFESPSEKTWLESLLHPLIRQEIKRQSEELHTPYIIIDIPLLIHRENFPYLNRILVVDCPENIQIKRVSHRDNISETAATQIINTQISRQQRNALADDIILNDSNDLNKLEKKVQELHTLYTNLSGIKEI